jgi:predicted extracellular nuclease
MKTNSLTHGEIAERARQIWEAEGNPTGRDTEIWLNAEQQLCARMTGPAKQSPATAARFSQSSATAIERLTSETAAESVVEFSLLASTPDAVAVQAALQTPESRGTQPPGKTAPQLAAATQVRGTGTSQSTATPATDPAPLPPPKAPAAEAGRSFATLPKTPAHFKS